MTQSSIINAVKRRKSYPELQESNNREKRDGKYLRLTLAVSDKSIPSSVNLKGLVTLHSLCYKEMEAGLSSLTAFAALLRSLFGSARR